MADRRATAWFEGFPDSSPESAYDRPPQRAVFGVTDIEADDGTAPSARAKWPSYCGWLFVESDGGALLAIYPGAGSGRPSYVTTGAVVWIGDGNAALAYVGAAPTDEVTLIGCTHADAMLYTSAAQAAAGAAAASKQMVTGPRQANAAAMPTLYPVTGSAAGRKVRIFSVDDPTVGANTDYIYIFASGETVASGVGVPVAVGGDLETDGAIEFGSNTIGQIIMIEFPEG